MSTGPVTPAGKARSCLNARKFGLSGRVAWPGQDPQADEEFFSRAWRRLAPRTAREETLIASLLDTRLRDHCFRDAETKVLTRRPVSHTLDVAAYPFLLDAGALKALNLLARQVAHLTRVFDGDLAELLSGRKHQRGKRKASMVVSPPMPPPGKCEAPDAEAVRAPQRGPAAAPPLPGSGAGLAELLADRSLLLPGEDAPAFAALAGALWTDYQPANLLEELIVSDIIQTQWRLDRLLQIQAVLLTRSAISASGHDCGFGFAFIQDCQRTQALEALRNYESVLRKRLSRRRALWPKLRKERWRDAVGPDPQPSTEGPAGAPTAGPASPPVASAALASYLPSEPGPPAGPSANAVLPTPPVAGSEAPPGQPAKPLPMDEPDPELPMNSMDTDTADLQITDEAPPAGAQDLAPHSLHPSVAGPVLPQPAAGATAQPPTVDVGRPAPARLPVDPAAAGGPPSNPNPQIPAANVPEPAVPLDNTHPFAGMSMEQARRLGYVR